MARRLGFIAGFLVVVALMAGCTSLGTYRGRIEAARASLEEAKWAEAKETAPEEYAKAEACLEGAWHSATTWCHDARVERYLQCAEQNVRLALRKAREVEVARPEVPPVPGVGPEVPPVPPKVVPPPEEVPPVVEIPPVGEVPPGVLAPPVAEVVPPVIEVPPVVVPPTVLPPPVIEVPPVVVPPTVLPPPVVEVPPVVARPPIVEVPPVEAPPWQEGPRVGVPFRGEEVPPEVEKFPPKIPPIARPPEKPVVPQVRTLEDIFFDFDKFLIREDARQTLNENVRWLREHPETRVLIEGHCDERGTHEYNLALGERRAKAAMEYLVASGIEPSRLSTISFGEERPFALGHDESAWRWNRRAHFVITLE